MNTIKIWICAAQEDFSEQLKNKIDSVDNFIITSECNDPAKLPSILKKDTPDLIFLDFQLTDEKAGLRLIKDIIAEDHSIKIILLLTEENEQLIYSAICAGVYDYYLKNQPLSNIKEKIHEVIQSDTPFGSMLKNKIKKSFESVQIAENNYNLTDREKEILNLVVAGLTKRKMAEVLVLSFHTIDSHLRNIYRKLGVQSKSQAIAKVLKRSYAPAE